MRILIILLFLFLLSGCYNKIVYVSVDQEAATENKLLLSDNLLDTQDMFEGDSQPVIELPLVP